MEKDILQLITELFKLNVNGLHQEYKSDNCSYVIDATKDGDTLTIKVKLSQNKDKEEFEKFVKEMDNDLFLEIYESLAKDIPNINEIYESENYKQVIELFKAKGRKLIKDKISDMQKNLNMF